MAVIELLLYTIRYLDMLILEIEYVYIRIYEEC